MTPALLILWAMALATSGVMAVLGRDRRPLPEFTDLIEET